MDGKVKVVMNGRMEPLGVEVKDGALGDAKVRLGLWGSGDGALWVGLLHPAIRRLGKKK